MTAEHFESIEKSLSSLASYSKLNDEKLGVVTKTLRQIGRTGLALATLIRENSDHTKQLASTVSAITNYIGVADDLILLHNTILMLKHGFITFDLLPIAQAKKILRQIQDHIQTSSLLFLAELDPLSFIKTQIFIISEQIKRCI